MSTEQPAEVQPTTAIRSGLVYTVAWSDDADPETIARFTPPAAFLPHGEESETTSWIMVGCRLRRFLAHVASRGGDPSAVVFDRWTDLASIAELFAASHGLPGRVMFDLADNAKATEVNGSKFGGRVSIVEADILGGTKVDAVPLEIGKGWVAIVAQTSPVYQVLAIPARSAAVATAYMLGSDCRRSRSESLLSMAADAHASYGAFVSLLDVRKVSRGLGLLEARAVRLGELLGLDAAVPVPSLYAFAERGGRATISVLPDPNEVH
jgi:hypothetical protein